MVKEPNGVTRTMRRIRRIHFVGIGGAGQRAPWRRDRADPGGRAEAAAIEILSRIPG